MRRLLHGSWSRFHSDLSKAPPIHTVYGGKSTNTVFPQSDAVATNYFSLSAVWLQLRGRPQFEGSYNYRCAHTRDVITLHHRTRACDRLS